MGRGSQIEVVLAVRCRAPENKTIRCWRGLRLMLTFWGKLVIIVSMVTLGQQ
jgi:hypothetical protein